MRRRRIRIAGFCLAGCILILGIVCGAFHHYVSQFPEDKIAENIYVGTVDLSGLSNKEALETDRSEESRSEADGIVDCGRSEGRSDT